MSYAAAGASTAVRQQALAVAMVCLIATGAVGEDRSQLPERVDGVLASVVSISVETTEKGRPAASGESKNSELGKPKIVRGTGIILRADGKVVTSTHVLDKASWKITVVFHDGRQSAAEVAGKDALTGVALLKLTPPAPLTPARFGNSDQSKSGQSIFSVGNPYGLRGTVASGIISAAGRDNATTPYPLLQTDIIIYPGVQGAPLFNMKGEVVGMASAAYASAGRGTPLSFAVPSNIVKHIAEKLEGAGAVERGFLGLRLREPNEQEVNSLGFKPGEGLIIVTVVPDGPSVSSGLAAGDAISTLNGQPVGHLGAFVRTIFDIAPDTEVTLGAIKKTTREDVRVKLGRVAEPIAAVAAAPAPATDKASDTAAGCSRYLPSAGMTVSVPCAE